MEQADIPHKEEDGKKWGWQGVELPKEINSKVRLKIKIKEAIELCDYKYSSAR